MIQINQDPKRYLFDEIAKDFLILYDILHHSEARSPGQLLRLQGEVSQGAGGAVPGRSADGGHRPEQQ